MNKSIPKTLWMIKRCFICKTSNLKGISASQLRNYSFKIKSMSSHELSTALRPFYFAVHPDLFWQQPHAKEVNENSLKELNSYLESLLKNVLPGPKNVTFYVRDTSGKNSHEAREVKTVNFKLQSHDLHATVHTILSTCHLSTNYIDAIKKPPKPPPETRGGGFSSKEFKFRDDIKWSGAALDEQTVDFRDRFKRVDEIDFSKWLKDNVDKAQKRAADCDPVRQEIERLSNILVEGLELNEIVWDCGWGLSHLRGCLQSFYSLIQQFPMEVNVLRGRTLVFGTQTGVSLEGEIILSSGHVKHTWLELLQNVPLYDQFLHQLPDAERALSDVLLGVKIDHRKFQPTVMVQKYINQLGKLASALYKYRWQHGYPDSWPRRLTKYQLVVEGEAGPLMLSPTGQFIVPAGCPAFLLVGFITDNRLNAEEKMKQYNSEKYREQVSIDEAMYHLGIKSLQKDNNVTPNLMISCLERLIENSQYWSPILRGSYIRVTNFYSVLQDGEICIPWNWKISDKS